MTAHILFVEDDSELRDLISRSLQKAGYHVTQAENGSQAIELLTMAPSDRPQYEVVLSDIIMGEIDGIEVMKVARSQPDPPEVILLTGNGTLQTAIEAVRSGAFDYMLKPSLVPRLLARVAAAVDQYRQKQGRAKEGEESPRPANHVDVPESVVEEVAAGPPSPSAPDEPSSPAAPSVERYLEVGALRIDTHRHEVWFNEQILRVTPTEYEILARLASTPERVVSYSDIAYHTYGSTMNEDEAHNLLRHHIRNLRRKFNRRYLVGVRGVGYMLDVQSTDDETD